MDLDLSDDQVAMRDGIHSLLEGRFSPERIRDGFDATVWQELDDAGVFSLVADGFTWADAVVVFEQLGEFCVPGPLVAGALSNGLDGAVGVVGCVDRPLDRAQALVEHLASIDTLLVLDSRGVFRVEPGELAAHELGWPLDPLTPVWRVEQLPSGSRVADAETARQWRHRGTVLTAAFALGLAGRCCEIAVAYSKEREQFDRPIGSFQAVKHILADMLVRTEVARAAVYAAAANLDDPEVPGLGTAVSVAKHVAGEAAVANGRAATQVYGGMGFTWEIDVHLYLKRAWVLQTHFGDTAAHADALAAALPAG